MADAKPVDEKKMLVEQHATNYQERIGEPYLIVWGRDMKHAGDLLKKYVYAKLAQWNREFFESEDKQIAEGGRTFPQFAYHLPRIITAATANNSKTLRMLKGIYYDPEQTRTPIRDALALLAVSFRADMEAPQTRSYERALAELKDEPEILQKAAELLIDEAASGRQFYPVPKPADVKGACAKVIEDMKVKAFADAAGVCDHSPKFFEEITREDGSTEMRRCTHWKVGKAAQKAISKPLTLPSRSHDQEVA